MKALAVGADVLVSKNEAGSMCKPLAAHASKVCGAFHSCVRTGAFHTRVTWIRGSGVSIPNRSPLRWTRELKVARLSMTISIVSCPLKSDFLAVKESVSQIRAALVW